VKIDHGSTIIDVLTISKAATSRNEAPRLVIGHGVSIDGTEVTDVDHRVDRDGLLKVGRRRFYQLRANR